ncbi:hypothetical protein SAMN05660359_02016 [Geodermatophilus obscurus]|uniref:Glucosyl transferase GtrII n=1 Tax=Geodermatophilus obscurus TaxID=1861 RepID=A0A1I5F9Y3_9ACTN|nr:DUF6056 family protein [Geodermatophilus obscurus]SFO20439.1 hypothetical protein SAMN05660359_02016 [Geodermatophilus obscurus]
MNSTLLSPEQLRSRVITLGWERVFLVALFLAFSGLALLFPFSGDDWAWGSRIGQERLSTFFDNYNGRYAGNLAVLVLTRSGFLAALVVAATVTAIVFLVVDLAESRTPLGYALATLLFIGMPVAVWRQAVVWTSGFANYALAALCVLVFVRVVKADWRHGSRRRLGLVEGVGTVMLGVVSALFMEHVTLYLVVASLAYTTCHRVVRGHFSARATCWSVALAAGAVLMFQNEAYRAAAGGENGYQQIDSSLGLGAVLRLVAKAGDVVSHQLVVQNVLLNVAVVVLVGALLLAAGPRVSHRAAVTVGGLAVVFLTLTLVLRNSDTVPSLPLSLRMLAGVAAFLLLGLLVVVTRLLVSSVWRRQQVYTACGSVVLLAGPLTIVEPVGPRCFFPTYVLLMVVVMVLLKEVTETAGEGASRYGTPVVAAVALATLAAHVVVYAVIQVASVERLDHIRAEVEAGATEVDIEPLPFRGQVHHPDPAWDVVNTRFKLFHGLPEDLELRVSD